MVIGVVALLTAILMPVLGRVKREGKAVVCQSKLKQWGYVFSMYMSDNDGMWIRGATTHRYGRAGWPWATRPYYYPEGKDILFCKDWGENNWEGTSKYPAPTGEFVCGFGSKECCIKSPGHDNTGYAFASECQGGVDAQACSLAYSGWTEHYNVYANVDSVFYRFYVFYDANHMFYPHSAKQAYFDARDCKVTGEILNITIPYINMERLTMPLFPSRVEKLKCPYSGCGKSFEKPTVLTDSTTIPRQTYYACPYCMSKVDILIEDTKIVGIRPTEYERVFKTPAKCAHYTSFGDIFPKNAPIPDECLVCPKVLQCNITKR